MKIKTEFKLTVICFFALLATVCLLLANGCTLVRTDMVPKPTWYWSKAAQNQREQDRLHKQTYSGWQTNFSPLPTAPHVGPTDISN